VLLSRGPPRTARRTHIVTIDETIPGAALNERLRLEQTRAILELTAAHLSRVHIVPRPSTDHNPATSGAFQKIQGGRRI
jgi:hypothetical protein